MKQSHYTAHLRAAGVRQGAGLAKFWTDGRVRNRSNQMKMFRNQQTMNFIHAMGATIDFSLIKMPKFGQVEDFANWVNTSCAWFEKVCYFLEFYTSPTKPTVLHFLLGLCKVVVGFENRAWRIFDAWRFISAFFIVYIGVLARVNKRESANTGAGWLWTSYDRQHL